MSVVNQHKHPLVVPEQVAPAFSGEILPKEFKSIDKKPEGVLAKVEYYTKKSSLIASPGISAAGMGVTSTALGMVHLGTETSLGVHLLGMSGLGIALGGLILFVSSLAHSIDGDFSMVPWSSNKSSREIDKKRQENIIAPFTEWDSVFSKHDTRAKLDQIINKKD